jgi:DNA-binding SARP family transcriptional activator/predicted ATPase
MEIGLFGACRVEWRSTPLALPRRQLRALLYRLAARLEPVSRAHLAFLFWPDEPDAAARRHLTRLLSSLRAALPQANLLVVTEETAALNPALCRSDSDAFWRLTAQPDRLATAVTLYAPFMTDFALPNAPEYEVWRQETARQLQRRYLDAVQTLVAQEMDDGRYPAAIQYARQYLAEDELDETMHARLIGLYAAVGDRTAALRQYEQCALILERELGVAPLPETRAAWQPMPTRLWPTLPALPTLDLPLTGREAVLRQIETAVAQGHGRLILLSGDPGAGKSRLLRETLARWPGAALVGAAHPGGEALPYQPILQALRITLAEKDLWAAVPPVWAAELSPLLPDLAVRSPNLPAPPVDSAQAQARLYEALTQTMTAFAARAPLLLALDDAQWADSATLGWLAYLAANPPPAQFALLAICRAQDLADLSPLRRAFARAGRLTEIEVAGLTAVAVQQLLAYLSPAPPPDLAARIHEATGGNPFFILEIARDLQESGQLASPPDNLPLPISVREAIMERLARLTPLARQLLETAAILAPHLEERALQRVAARSERETADALDELAAQQLIRLSPLRLAHNLLQTAALQSLNPWRRKLLHRRAGETLARLRSENGAALAEHFAAAEEWETAVTYYQQAAAQARNLYAYEVALTQLNRAFALLPHLPQPPTITQVALLRQRLALRRILVQLAEWEADAADLLQLAAAVEDNAARLEALEAQISLRVLQSDFALAEATAEQALALAQQLGDRLAEARIRQTLGWHLADALGRSREGLVHLQAACDLARAVGATAVLYQALCNLAFAQRAEGQCAAARASAAEALALTSYQPGSPPQPAFADALRELGEANAYLGRWEEAREQLRPLLDLYQTLNDPWAYGAVLFNYGLYSSNMGQHEEAVAALRRLVALSESVGLPADSDYGIWHRAGLVRVLVAAGQLAAAGELLRGLATEKLALGRPYLAWARATAEYHLAQGEGAAALAAAQPAVEWWRQAASLHDADILLLLAQAKWAVGDWEGATAAVNEAAAIIGQTDIARFHLRLRLARRQITGA